MKILTGKQIREADERTMTATGIDSLTLMEYAAESLAQAMCQRVEQGSELLFVVGKGNNGGDGLAMARILANAGFDCSVCMLFSAPELSPEALANFERLPEEVSLVAAEDLKRVGREMTIVDAILGSGVSGEVHGAAAEAIAMLNTLPNTVISIDLPSGMRTEFGNDPALIVHAEVTLAIQFPKLAMLLPEAGACCGEIEVVEIGLDEEFLASAASPYHFTTRDEISAEVGALGKRRGKFCHKGDYGHALLVCGSRQMPGAAILATCAALRSGCGLVTTHLPETCVVPLMANAPSAMVSIDPHPEFILVPADVQKYSSIGVGCGIGTSPQTSNALRTLLLGVSRGGIVLDADALNIIASKPELRRSIPRGAILTPHPGEFRRLVGEWTGEEEKIAKARALASELASTVILKGSHTIICTPSGEVYFNSTGNPGMAKGGSGDLLTGLLAGLLARGYAPEQAARIGVYVHGAAGDKARDYYGEEAMHSSDMIDFLADALSEL